MTPTQNRLAPGVFADTSRTNGHQPATVSPPAPVPSIHQQANHLTGAMQVEVLNAPRHDTALTMASAASMLDVNHVRIPLINAVEKCVGSADFNMQHTRVVRVDV